MPPWTGVEHLDIWKTHQCSHSTPRHVSRELSHIWELWESLQWRHNRRDGVSNLQPHHYLLNCLFRNRSQKTSKLRVTGLCAENSPVTGEFPLHKWPVTRKMFPFDDVRWNHLTYNLAALRLDKEMSEQDVLSDIEMGPRMQINQ